MTGLAILKTVEQVMTRRPSSVEYGTPVLLTRRKMLKEGVAHMLIRRHGAYVKILSERDVLYVLPERMKELKAMPSGSLASSRPLSVGPRTTIREAAKVMLSNKARLLLVSAKPLGCITATDLANSLPWTSGAHPKLASSVTGHVEKVDYNTPLETAVLIMRERRIGSVLVTRHGKRYGIFTERDLMSVLASSAPDFSSSVGAYCSRPLLTAPLTSTMKEAVSLMKRNRIKRLPVTKEIGRAHV